MLFSYQKERPKTAQIGRTMTHPSFFRLDKDEVLQYEMTKPVVDKVKPKIKGKVDIKSQTVR